MYSYLELTFKCKFAFVLKTNIGSFCDVRTCTASRFVAYLDGGKNTLVKFVLR